MYHVIVSILCVGSYTSMVFFTFSREIIIFLRVLQSGNYISYCLKKILCRPWSIFAVMFYFISFMWFYSIRVIVLVTVSDMLMEIQIVYRTICP
jgi:hypothetical protein